VIEQDADRACDHHRDEDDEADNYDRDAPRDLNCSYLRRKVSGVLMVP
jgi:hypothetical protein